MFHDYLHLILFQIWGSTLHWVLLLHKLLGSTCCPGCMAVAAYANLKPSDCVSNAHATRHHNAKYFTIVACFKLSHVAMVTHATLAWRRCF